MTKLAVVTDSTAYIPEDLIEKFNIHIIPLSVVFEETSYQEQIDISTGEFYKKVEEATKLPSTSQPPIGLFIELYETLAKQYDVIISIHLSKEISGTYNTAISAGSMIEEAEIYAFDSGLSCMPQGLFAIVASEMAAEGKSAEEILDYLEKMKAKTYAYFMVDDLKHLQLGGRLTGAQALVGSLLNIKPVLHMPEGAIVPYEKIRTRKKALQKIMAMLEEEVQKNQVLRVVFMHAHDESEAVKLQQLFQEKHPNIETIISYFGPVIGTHLGKGALGVSWYIE